MQSDMYYKMLGVEDGGDDDTNDEESEDNDNQKLGVNKRRKRRVNIKKRRVNKTQKAKYYARLSVNNLNKAHTYANNNEMVKARKYEEKAARYAKMSSANHPTKHGKRVKSKK